MKAKVDELTKNEKDELFKNTIQAYVQYPEELKQKGKKVAMKIISHAWRSYRSKLVKLWREKESPFHMYKSVNRRTFLRIVSTCSAFDRRMSLATTLATQVMLVNRGSGTKRMKDWPNKVLRIHMTNSLDSW
jgi:hypothetical protein